MRHVTVADLAHVLRPLPPAADQLAALDAAARLVPPSRLPRAPLTVEQGAAVEAAAGELGRLARERFR